MAKKKNVTYAVVDKLEIFRSEIDFFVQWKKDKMSEFTIVDAVKPLVEVCAVLCIE